MGDWSTIICWRREQNNINFLKSIRYSQNFIANSSLVRDLVRKSSMSKDDVVYEIGPGTGVITRELAKQCKKVIAVEIDNNLTQKLKEKFSATLNIEIQRGDFLNYSISEPKYKVFSNIPFNITADIIKKLTGLKNPPLDAFLFVQKEAAEKFIGQPLTKETQASILLKSSFELSVVHKFKKTDFRPVPGVDIVLLRILKRSRPLIETKNLQLYRDFITYIFNSQKPVLKQGLKKIFTNHQFSRLAEDLKFPESAKPTDLDFSQWFGLFDFFLKGTDVSKKLLIRSSEDVLRNQQSKLQKVHRTRVAKNWRDS